MINFLKDQFSRFGFQGWLFAYSLAFASLYLPFAGYILVLFLFLDIVVVFSGLIDPKNQINHWRRPDKVIDHHMNIWFDLIFGSGLVVLFLLNNSYLLAGTCILAVIADLTRNDRVPNDRVYNDSVKNND